MTWTQRQVPREFEPCLSDIPTPPPSADCHLSSFLTLRPQRHPPRVPPRVWQVHARVHPRRALHGLRTRPPPGRVQHASSVGHRLLLPDLFVPRQRKVDDKSHTLPRRRHLARTNLKPNQIPMTLTSFPRLGVPGKFTEPYYDPAGAISSHSLFLPEEITNPHARFPCVAPSFLFSEFCAARLPTIGFAVLGL
jgi:hypothetical protein